MLEEQQQVVLFALMSGNGLMILQIFIDFLLLVLSALISNKIFPRNEFYGLKIFLALLVDFIGFNG